MLYNHTLPHLYYQIYTYSTINLNSISQYLSDGIKPSNERIAAHEINLRSRSAAPEQYIHIWQGTYSVYDASWMQNAHQTRRQPPSWGTVWGQAQGWFLTENGRTSKSQGRTAGQSETGRSVRRSTKERFDQAGQRRTRGRKTDRRQLETGRSVQGTAEGRFRAEDSRASEKRPKAPGQSVSRGRIRGAEEGRGWSSREAYTDQTSG